MFIALSVKWWIIGAKNSKYILEPTKNIMNKYKRDIEVELNYK